MFENRSSNPVNNYVVKTVLLRGVSYTAELDSSMLSLEIYESIDGLSSGVVFIQDQHGVSDIVAPTGLEAIDIEFASKKGDEVGHVYRKTFRVTGITRHKSKAGNTETLSLSFTNNLITQNDFVKRPYVFSETSISNMVKNILDNLGDEAPVYNIEKTLFPRSYTSHIAKPLDIIYELKSYANSSVANSCHYLFYEDRDAVNFVSIGSLRNREYEYIVRSGAENGVGKFDGGLGNILYPLRISVAEQSAMRDISNGIFGARTYTHSLINKRIETMDLRRDDYISTIGVMNDVAHLYTSENVLASEVPFAEQPLNSIQLMPSDGFYRHDNKHELGSIHSVAKMEESYINAKKITIEVAGNTNLTVGDSLWLEYGSVSDNQTSVMASGKWIISDLKHKVDGKSFVTTVDVVSDSSITSTSIRRNR